MYRRNKCATRGEYVLVEAVHLKRERDLEPGVIDDEVVQKVCYLASSDGHHRGAAHRRSIQAARTNKAALTTRSVSLSVHSRILSAENLTSGLISEASLRATANAVFYARCMRRAALAWLGCPWAA